MRKILLILATLFSFAASAQTFPDTDSLKRYNDQYIRNSAITAFTNNRLNTLLKGIIEQLGGSGSGGTQIELRNTGTYIQWKYTNQSDFFWVNLISIASITGPAGAAGANGAPGPAVELQNNGTYIQYRVVGSGTWINLVALSDITGPPGSGGGGGGGTWGSITGTLASQLDLSAALAARQPIGSIFFTGLKTGMGSVTVPNTFPIIQTSGYSLAGKGGAKYVRADSTGTANQWRFKSADGQWWDLAESYVTPEMFGALGDSTDANAAIQAGLEYTRAGTIYRYGTGTGLHFSGGKFLYSKLLIHSGNLLTDSRVQGKGGFNYSNGNGSALIHITNSIPADSFSITTDMNASGFGINGLQIIGGGVGSSTTTTGGIKVYSGTGGNANDFRITNNTIKGWGIEALVVAGSPYTIEKNMVQGCNNVAYVQGKGVPTGVIRASGADATIINNEFTGSSNQGGSGNFLTPSAEQLIGAAYFAGLGVSKLAFNIYQVAETGLRHPGQENKYTSERFDTNAGSGLYFVSGGSDNIFTNTQIIRNSLAGTGLYDGIYAATSGGRNNFDGLTFGAGALYNSIFYQMRYFINDQKGDLGSKNPFTNTYLNVRFTSDPSVAKYNFPSITEQSGKVIVPSGGPFKRLTLNSTTPSVYENGNLYAFNSTPTSITAFREVVEGQEFNLLGSASNGAATYVKHGDSVKLRKGTDSLLVQSDRPMKFVIRNKIAYQLDGAEVGEGTYQPTSTVLSELATNGAGAANGSLFQRITGQWRIVTGDQLIFNIQAVKEQRFLDSIAAVRSAIGSGGGGSGVTDGDKGDITISGTGTVYTVDAGVINDSKIATGVSATKIGANTNVSNTEYGYLDGVTSSIQTQIGGKLNTPSGNGIVAHTGSGAATARTITPANAEVIVNNGDAVAGNPVISLAASIARQQTLIDTAAQIRAYLDTASSVLPISYYPELTDSFPTIGGMVRKVRDSVAALYTTKANINSPTFTGTPQSVTFATTDSTDKIATMKAVKQIVALVPSGGSAGVVATAAEINTGTDNVKYATPLGLDGSEYITQGNEKLYATTAGTGTAYTLNLTPAPAAYVTGMVIYAKFHLANTGAATINVNSLGAISIVKEVTTALVAGDIPINKFVQLIYNGTQFQIASPFSDVLKANLASPTFTGTATIPTATITTGTVATLQGSTTSSGALTIQSTSNATKGRIILNSNLGSSITTIFGAQTLTFSFNTWICSASAAYSVTLPAAGASTGVIYTIKKVADAFTVTIQANGAETIDGANTQTLTTAYQFMTLQSNGTSWYLISKG